MVIFFVLIAKKSYKESRKNNESLCKMERNQATTGKNPMSGFAAAIKICAKRNKTLRMNWLNAR